MTSYTKTAGILVDCMLGHTGFISSIVWDPGQRVLSMLHTSEGCSLRLGECRYGFFGT